MWTFHIEMGITIEWANDLFQPESIHVFNAMGLLCKSISVNDEIKSIIQVDDLNDGLYFIVSRNGFGEIATNKVLIVRK